MVEKEAAGSQITPTDQNDMREGIHFSIFTVAFVLCTDLVFPYSYTSSPSF